MKSLLDKSAIDSTIINTLIDLVPDMQCLLSADYDAELKLYLAEYIHCSYFVEAINRGGAN